MTETGSQPRAAMNLRQLEVFYAVMRTGSVTAAARLLNVTQPAISIVLRHCEDQLRLKLFTRTGGRLQPTPEAQAIFPDVAAIFGRLDAVSRLTQDLAGGRLGTLSVAAAFPIANGYLAKAVAAFLHDRPRVQVALQSLTTPQVVERVVSREVELGVGFEPISNSEVETELLVRSGIACVMRDDHPLAGQSEVAVGELLPYALITYLPQTIMRPHVERAFAEVGSVPGLSVQVSLSLTGLMLAYYGAGVALVEPYLLAFMPLPGLVARPLRPRIEIRTLLIRAKQAPRSAAMDDFVGYLKRTVLDRPVL